MTCERAGASGSSISTTLTLSETWFTTHISRGGVMTPVVATGGTLGGSLDVTRPLDLHVAGVDGIGANLALLRSDP